MKKSLLLLFSALCFWGQAQLLNVRQTSATGGANTMMSTMGLKYTSQNNLLFGYSDMSMKGHLVKFDTQGDTIYCIMTNPVNPDEYTEGSDGSVYMYRLNTDSFIMNKVDPNGDRKWQRKITLPPNGSWSGIASTSIGVQNYFVLGSNYWAGGTHLYLGKTDSAGNMLFYRSVDMTPWLGSNVSSVNPRALRVTPAGNLILMGNTNANAGVAQHLFVMQIDPSSGLINWVKGYQTGVGNGAQTFYPYTLGVTANNELLISGQYNSPTGTGYMRLDQNGDFLWAKNIADGVYNTHLIELSNGNLALHMARSNQVSDGVLKNMLSILDASGNVLLTRTYGDADMNGVGSTVQAGTNLIAALGYASNKQSLCIFTMDMAGNAVGCHEVIPTLPVTTWTANFVSQTLTSVAEATPTLINMSASPFTGLTFNKSVPGITTNGNITHPLCYGMFGQVTISPTGGASPYNYKWSNGTNSQNLLNVPGGIYTVRVADNAGCVELDTFNVMEPPQLTATYTVSHVTCFGAQNGSINVTTIGGTPGYEYQWTTLSTTEDLTGLSGGFYQLTITDTNNCSKTVAVAVSEPQQLIAGIMSSQNVTCHGACNGSLTGVGSGGTPPYTYLWNNPGSSTTTTVTGLCPGNYLFSVTDSKSCFTFANAVITEPAALGISSATASAHCGAADGAASAMVSGGVTPYTYTWTSSSNNDTASNLASGTYTISVLDANNCPISATVNVGLTTDPSELCMVTVDSMSTHNILLWDKTAFNNVDYFNIYREDITNNYTLIAAVEYDSLSEYHDYDTLNADPNITTKRYKISAVDTCGNESVKSNFHNTIFIAHNAGTFTWNTYTIQNSANPVTSYRLMRDDFATGNWQQIGTTAGTQNVLNDPNYTSFQATADWRVETVWGISCTSTAKESNEVQGTIIKSKSNITNNRVTGIAESGTLTFGMYPNPAGTTVIITTKSGATLVIVNALGQTVKTAVLEPQSNTLDISGLATGTYYVKMGNGNGQVVKKLLVQR